MFSRKHGLLWLFTMCNSALLIYLLSQTSFQLQNETTRNVGTKIPALVGTWIGPNETVSDLKGYRYWGEKKIDITEQKGRRFRGHFTYPGGTINFFGVIYPDNQSFTWVSSGSHGYNHGRILANGKISACYLESWEQATAGCATLSRKR